MRAAGLPSNGLTSHSESMIGQIVSEQQVHVEVEEDSDLDASSRRSSHSGVNQWGGGLGEEQAEDIRKQVIASLRTDSPHDVTASRSVGMVTVTPSTSAALTSQTSSAVSSRETLVAESSLKKTKNFPRSRSFNVLRRQMSREYSDDVIDGLASQAASDQPVYGLKKIRSSDRLTAHNFSAFSRAQVLCSRLVGLKFLTLTAHLSTQTSLSNLAISTQVP